MKNISKSLAVVALLSASFVSAQNLSQLKETAVGKVVETQVNQTKENLVKKGEDKLEDYKKQGEEKANSTVVGSIAKKLVDSSKYKKNLDAKIEEGKTKLIGESSVKEVEQPVVEEVEQPVVEEVVSTDVTSVTVVEKKKELSENILKGNSTVNNANYKIDQAKTKLEQDKKEGNVTTEEYQSKLQKIQTLTEKVQGLSNTLNLGKSLK